MTGDSDQIPAIKALRALAPKKEVVAVFPVNRHSANLKNHSDRAIQLTWRHFANNQLANPFCSSLAGHCNVQQSGSIPRSSEGLLWGTVWGTSGGNGRLGRTQRESVTAVTQSRED